MVGDPRGGTAEPMRVLVATSRSTTYVRHATRDLTEAFECGGVSVHVLEERDDHSVLWAGEYCRAIAEHDLDLIVTANYPRWKLSSVVPENVPFVRWVQDAMPHMYEHDAGGRVARRHDHDRHAHTSRVSSRAMHRDACRGDRSA